jgi:hypothetical protein
MVLFIVISFFKNQNCLICEAALSNRFDNLAHDRNEAALTRHVASRHPPVKLYKTPMLSVHGQRQPRPVTTAAL